MHLEAFPVAPGTTGEVDGFALMNQGVTIRLAGALTSELLIMEAA